MVGKAKLSDLFSTSTHNYWINVFIWIDSMRKLRPYTRRLNGKTFKLIGEGSEAKVWEVQGIKEKRKKGTIIRTVKPGVLHHGTRFWKEFRLQERFIAMQV